MKEAWKRNMDQIYEAVTKAVDSSSVYFKDNRMARMDFIYFVGFWMTYCVMMTKRNVEYGTSFEDWYEDHLFSQCGLSRSEIQRLAVSRCASYQDIMLAHGEEERINKWQQTLFCFIRMDMEGHPFGFPNHKVSSREMEERMPALLSLLGKAIEDAAPYYDSIIRSDKYIVYK